MVKGKNLILKLFSLSHYALKLRSFTVSTDALNLVPLIFGCNLR